MSFGEAIRSGFDNYVNFDGRASRAAFWWWFLFEILVLVAAVILDGVLGTYPIIYALAALALFLPSLAVAVRRLHDTNRTGWWVLINFVPFIGFIVLLIFWLEQGTPGPNEYGPPPADTPAAAAAQAPPPPPPA